MINGYVQLLIHGISDYFFQTEYQALNKKKPGFDGLFAAFSHAFMYTVPFILLTRSITALLVIMITHFIIDRTELVSYLVWLKNYWGAKILLENFPSWQECKSNFGFSPARPIFIAFWITIITDNVFHLIINYLALRYL